MPTTVLFEGASEWRAGFGLPADMVSLPIELDHSEANTTGAKGLGEPVTIPTAAAIANAVYHATGVRVTATPINPLQLCRLLAEHQKEG
jgi:xanthine dehydrogenase YagR molybdenum-binding subunit